MYFIVYIPEALLTELPLMSNEVLSITFSILKVTPFRVKSSKEVFTVSWGIIDTDFTLAFTIVTLGIVVIAKSSSLLKLIVAVPEI